MGEFVGLKKALPYNLRCAWLFGLALAFPSLHSAIGAEIQTVKVDRDEAIISIIGQLETGDGEKFSVATAGIKNALVLFKSPGGNLGEGINIGDEIRKKRFSTAVPFDDMCASACAIAWVLVKTFVNFDVAP